MIRQLVLFYVLALAGVFTSINASANQVSLQIGSTTIDLLPKGGRLYLAEQLPSAAPVSPGAFVGQLTPVSQINRMGGKYWLYARVKNNTAFSRWVFDPHNSIIDRVYGFVYRKDDVQTLRTGHLYPHEHALHYGKRFELLPGESAEVLIYFDSRYYSSLPSFELTPEQHFQQKMLSDNVWILGCLGAVLVLSLYNLFLGVWTRDRNYVYYALYLAFSMLGWSAAFNFWAEWWGWYSLKLILIPFFPAIAFNILYYIHFLQLRESCPRLAKVSYAMVALCVLLSFSYSFLTPGSYFMLLSMVTAIWVVLGLGIGITRLRQGYMPALFFVAAFSVVFVAAGLSILPNLGYKELIYNADLFTLVAQTIDMLLLALALAHRIRIMRDERESALQAAVDSEQRASKKEKQANRVLTEANIKLKTALDIAEEESQKKNEFLRMVSHELRTPLHSIASSAEEWNDSRSHGDKKELIQYITYGAARLRTQVDNLVLLAETDGDNLVAGNYIFEIQPIIERLSENVTTLLSSRNVKFVINANNLPQALCGDGYLLEHLLRTNLENACKYTFDGKVRLDIDWLPEQQALQMRLMDTGQGMSQAQLVSVFEDFFQLSQGLDRESEGLGLGLTVCRRLCKALNADFDISSEPNIGTTVTMSVPMSAMSDEMSVQTNASRGRVLIVEDNPVNAKVLGRIIESCGYQGDIVHSGMGAIEAVSEKAYAVILMDIQMPGMDGITATTEIRKRGVITPIIAVTANSDIQVRTECMAHGMNGFLVKPVRKADIHRALERQLPFTV